MSKLSEYDKAAVALSIVALTAYHLNLYVISPHFSHSKVPFAASMKNCFMWLQKHKENNESPSILLAIQTLRNTMMAAVFIGGNSITIAYSMSNAYPDLKDERLQVRSIIITLMLFSSFLCWANVIRVSSLLGYYIGTLKYSEKLRKEKEQEEAEQHQHLNDSSEMDSRNNSNYPVVGDPVRYTNPGPYVCEEMVLSPFRKQQNEPDSSVQGGSDAASTCHSAAVPVPAPVGKSSAIRGVPTARAGQDRNRNRDREADGDGDGDGDRRRGLRRRLPVPSVHRVDYQPLIHCAADIPDIELEAQQMVKLLTYFFSFGFRLLFVSIPFALYSTGPTALLLTTFFLLLFLRTYDTTRHLLNSE
jgi:hypothetical protein